MPYQCCHHRFPAAACAIQCEMPSCNTQRILVLYSYYETPRALRNLAFFLEKTKTDYLPEAERHSNIHYIFIINGGQCRVDLPTSSNVRILRVKNTGSDMAGYAAGLEEAGVQSNNVLRKKLFSYFIFINSSCRGPFLPQYLDGLIHWTTPFIRMMSDNVKLVGPSIQFIPGAGFIRTISMPSKVTIILRLPLLTSIARVIPTL